MEANLTTLEFKDIFFDAIVCLNADLPDIGIFKFFKDQPLLAADGAAISLHKLGLEPDYVVGDLDSFSESPISRNYDQNKIVHKPDQESNDFEKILQFAIDKSYENILILGFHGGELEHTLNNWSVFKRYSKRINLCIYDKGRYGLSIDRPVQISCSIDEIISLIPQPTAKISSKGLKWELQDEYLTIGIREGARNRAILNKVCLNIIEGEILFFCNARLPYAAKFII